MVSVVLFCARVRKTEVKTRVFVSKKSAVLPVLPILLVLRVLLVRHTHLETHQT